MSRLLLGCLLSCAVAFPAAAALRMGDPAPDFTAEAAVAGKSFSFSLKEALKKGPVVVYFYPAAFTNACNIQAHQFAANHEKFVAAGATVVGVSLDSIERLKAFSADPDACGGKVAVASDADGSISKSFDLRVQDPPPGTTDTQGVPIEHGMVEQVTFVVAPDGTIAAVVADDSPTANVAKALEAVKRLAVKQLTRSRPPGAFPSAGIFPVQGNRGLEYSRNRDGSGLSSGRSERCALPRYMRCV